MWSLSGSRRQERRFEGAGAGAVARSQHLTGEMVQSVVSFYEEGDKPINSARARGCQSHSKLN